MRIGLFSDIHGNYYAFEKIYKELMQEKCDRYIFCGDICGYYFSQNEVIDMLLEIPKLVAVAGNHDMMLFKCLDDEQLFTDYTVKYGNSMMHFRKNISQRSLAFLKSLPDHYIDESAGLAVFHGSPWDYYNGYVYPTDSLDQFATLPYKYIILGHTHYCMVREIQNIRVINPGSSGQPRDGGDPSYGILNLETDEVEIKRVPYDKQALIRDVNRYDREHAYLVDVLLRQIRAS